MFSVVRDKMTPRRKARHRDLSRLSRGIRRMNLAPPPKTAALSTEISKTQIPLKYPAAAAINWNNGRHGSPRVDKDFPLCAMLTTIRTSL